MAYPPLHGDCGGFRPEYIDGYGWRRGPHRLRNVKPRYAFVWPNDKPGRGSWGRFKDIMSGKGPDIHIGISADGRDRFHGGPVRSRWSRWPEYRRPWERDNALRPAPWARRKPYEKYNFRTRKYESVNPAMWSDARWPDDRRQQKIFGPYAVRDVAGVWRFLDDAAYW